MPRDRMKRAGNAETKDHAAAHLRGSDRGQPQHRDARLQDLRVNRRAAGVDDLAEGHKVSVSTGVEMSN